MKLKLLIVLVAVPTLVMAQAGLPSANVGSSVQTGATPTQQTAPNPNSTTGSSAATGSSTTPTNVGGKVDGHGSSYKATVKGSSENYCPNPYKCN